MTADKKEPGSQREGGMREWKKEEAKQQRSEREMTWGVEGLRERWMKREWKVSGQWGRENRVKAVGKQRREGEKKRGGCHPWLPLITHSLMMQFFSLPPLLSFLLRGRGGGGVGVRPAPNQTGSNRVHNLQVGPSSTRETLVYAFWLSSDRTQIL